MRHRTGAHALRPLRSFLLALAVAGGCATTPPPLYDGLGDAHCVVSTDVELAQTYFDQGLALSWGFNHDEAVRSFEEAARLDPDCPMVHWGRAYALGPNINRRKIDDDEARDAYAAIQRAVATKARASAREAALIDALAVRFAETPPEDRAELNVAYADAMRDVYEQYPDDVFVGTLYADALMNIDSDWRDWGTDEERGPNTPLVIATLEHVLELDPDHPGANHLYIHSVEASYTPERGLESANRLEGLMPAAGHMVHMPSHIYMRLGMYDEAVASNTRAALEDDRFFAQAPRQGIYHLYRAHNRHFLAWAAMFRGSYGDAMTAAREMEERLPQEESTPKLDSYRFVPMHVMMRFGRWDDMLAEPAPEDRFPIALALWHHGRAIAYANTGRTQEARAEAQAFEDVAATVEGDTKVFASPIGTVLEAARQMMLGEILYEEGDHEAAFAALRKGVEAEDALHYSEPPGWMQPIRHALGALLLADDRLDEAEEVYREDLERHAGNVWSLHGLTEALRRQEREWEALRVEQQFEKAAAHADVPIRASCFCRDVDA